MHRVAMLSITLLACGEGTRPEPASMEEPLHLTAADSAIVAERGALIATGIAQGLAERLQARMADEGVPGAVDFCARAALELTDSLVAAYPGANVKRTSTRIRNPRNAPDALENDALIWFDSVHSATGTLPASLVQVAGSEEVRFYRPLVVAPFCTECHGAPAALDPAVRALLVERYPDDQAVGYEAGELRGVIRVSLPRQPH